MLDYLLLCLKIVATCIAVASVYYAVRMILYMRYGRMERGWEYITIGAVILVVRSVFSSLTDIGEVHASLDLTYDTITTTMMCVGFVLLFLGFRSLYRAWSLKDLARTREKQRESLV